MLPQLVMNFQGTLNLSTLHRLLMNSKDTLNIYILTAQISYVL